MEAAVFSVRDMFGGASDSDDEASPSGRAEDAFAEREVEFPGRSLRIREFSFHAVNANLVWPGCQVFAAWLQARPHLLRNRKILEMGSGTGALAIFLSLEMKLRVTTCDYDDEDIESNIRHNCVTNGVPPLDHIRHTWGDSFPLHAPPFDLVIASDILLYVKQYSNLVKTIHFLLRRYQETSSQCRNSLDDGDIANALSASPKPNEVALDVSKSFRHNSGNSGEVDHLPKPSFLMSWRRRLPSSDEQTFFTSCREKGLEVVDLESRVYLVFIRN